MQLTTTGTSILGAVPHAKHRERIDPQRALAVLVAQGMRPVVAAEAAWGELSSEAARRLGETVKLITKE